jgi:WD40 repeat protein
LPNTRLAGLFKTLQPIQTIEAYVKQQIRTVAFSPTQLVIASGDLEEGLKLWNPQSGKNLYSQDQSMRAIDEIYFSRDGKWLATSHEDGLLRVWDVNAGQEARYSPLPGYLPKGVPFSPDNRFLVFIAPVKEPNGYHRILDLNKKLLLSCRAIFPSRSSSSQRTQNY